MTAFRTPPPLPAFDDPLYVEDAILRIDHVSCVVWPLGDREPTVYVVTQGGSEFLLAGLAPNIVDGAWIADRRVGA